MEILRSFPVVLALHQQAIRLPGFSWMVAPVRKPLFIGPGRKGNHVSGFA